MLCILKTIVASAVMMLAGIYLILFIVRGVVGSHSFVGSPTDRVTEVLRRESRRTSVGNMVMTLLSILAIAAYLFALFHFWNVWLAMAGVIFMVSRIPALLWEIRRNIRTGDKEVWTAKRPWDPVYIVAEVLFWLSPLLVWYSLCVRTP